MNYLINSSLIISFIISYILTQNKYELCLSNQRLNVDTEKRVDCYTDDEFYASDVHD